MGYTGLFVKMIRRLLEPINEQWIYTTDYENAFKLASATCAHQSSFVIIPIFIPNVVHRFFCFIHTPRNPLTLARLINNMLDPTLCSRSGILISREFKFNYAKKTHGTARIGFLLCLCYWAGKVTSKKKKLFIAILLLLSNTRRYNIYIYTFICAIDALTLDLCRLFMWWGSFGCSSINICTKPMRICV